MRKKAVFAFTAIAVSVFSACNLRYDNEKDYLIETIDDGTSAMITGYSGKKTKIRIPPKIQGMPVTKIGDRAFSDEKFDSVAIPLYI